MNLKLVAKYAILQAPLKHENQLAGSGGDSRARATAAYGQNTAFMANLGPLSVPGRRTHASRKPGLQAPSNLAVSKTKITKLFGQLNVS